MYWTIFAIVAIAYFAIAMALRNKARKEDISLAVDESLKDALLGSADIHFSEDLKTLVRKWDEHPTAVQILVVIDHNLKNGGASPLLSNLLYDFYTAALAQEQRTHEEVSAQLAFTMNY